MNASEALSRDYVDALLDRGLPIVEAMAFDFIQYAESLGETVEFHVAQTGTCYVTVEGLGVVRFADHADAYGNADYTCDDIEGSYRGAISWLVNKHDEAMAAEAAMMEEYE